MRDLINFLCTPWLFFPGAVVAFALMFALRRGLVRGRVALAILVGTLVLFGVSPLDDNFAHIALKPDNVPIVGMLFALGFFVWLSLRRAVLNDQRAAAGLGPQESEDAPVKIHVWPDLVYIELIVMVLAAALLIVWSLVYFDPWIAGVLLPGLIIVGLLAIPYLDRNPKGSGYYTFSERKFAITTFCFGFLVLWVLLIAVGITIVAAYFFVGQPLLGWTVMKKFRQSMGWWRFHSMAFMLLAMTGLVVKMFLRWTIDLKYVISIPEYMFNI